MDWCAPLQTIKGINDILSRKFSKLGVHCLGDLLCHFPFRYEDHTRITPIRCLRAEQSALIEGKIIRVDQAGRQKKRYIIQICDQSALCEIVFFHSFPSQRQQWTPGSILRCFGLVKRGKKGFQMSHPDWVRIPEGETLPLPSHLTPIYPAVTGLTQARIRNSILIALDWLAKDNKEEDPFSELYSLKEAFRIIHLPMTDIDPIR